MTRDYEKATLDKEGFNQFQSFTSKFPTCIRNGKLAYIASDVSQQAPQTDYKTYQSNPQTSHNLPQLYQHWVQNTPAAQRHMSPGVGL